MQNICWKPRAGQVARGLLAALVAAQSLMASAATLFVWQNSPSPAPPYATWASAATNIQDAIDAATAGDEIVVTNGVYATGGRGQTPGSATSNRVSVIKPLTVRSLNGPEVTVIRGAIGVRCASLTNDAMLSGFTLTNAMLVEDLGAGVLCYSVSAVVSNCIIMGNSTHGSGGGAWGGTLRRCLLAGNGAQDDGGGACFSILDRCTLSRNYANDGGGGAYGSTLNDCILTANRAPKNGGGGAFSCTLNRCTLTENSAGDAAGGGASNSRLNNCLLTVNSAGIGGGAAACAMNNCTVTDNSADENGGVAGCALTNCVVYFNTARNWPNWSASLLTFIAFTCTTPLPDGPGNISSKPTFTDRANGNFRLQSNSPCINSGYNAFAAGGPDLDGSPRIAGGTVDMGAYEFQTPGSALSYAWLLRHGMPLDGSADSADPDGDLFDNYHEWRAGTDPRRASSLLRMLPPRPLGLGLAVSWQSVPGRSYVLERSTDLGVTPHFLTLATGLPAAVGTNTTTFTHTNAVGPWFYRIGVEE